MLSNAFLIERHLLGVDKPRMGNRGASVAPCDLYEVTDGWVLLQVAGQPMFKRWCRLIGREDLIDDPRFVDDDSRWKHGDFLNDLMQDWCTGKTKAEVLDALEAAKLPAAPMHSTQDVLEDPHIKAMGYLKRCRSPAHPVTYRSSRRRSACRRPPAPSVSGRRCSVSTPTRCSPRSVTAQPKSSDSASVQSSEVPQSSDQ